MKRSFWELMVMGVVSFVPTFAHGQVIWSQGHGDIEVSYLNGEWEWTVEDGRNPSETIIAIDNNGLNLIPDVPSFSFLGEPGAKIWIVSQSETVGVPFVGLASDTPNGVFENNRFSLSLTNFKGPGNFHIWSTGSSGQVNRFASSSDGLDDQDVVNMPAPGHLHYNLGFTTPGTYSLGWTASGTLMNGEGLVTSDETIYEFAVNVLREGELDLEVIYHESGEWELAFLREADGVEFDPSDVALHVGAESLSTVPGGSAYSFLGEPGSDLYVLPQEEKEGLLFVGIAGDEIPEGVFESEQVNLTLVSVSGPGETFLYTVDAFGSPNVSFNSADGLSAEDIHPVSVGGHAHQNWAFTKPGFYVVELQASGVLAGSGESVNSEIVKLYFEVEEPVRGPKLHLETLPDSKLRLSWQSQTGELYQVQSIENLNSTSWTSISEPLVGSGDFVSMELPIESVIGKYFRVEVVTP